ncbi:MAG: GNAT family N-acetyltransferase [Candidatus Paceibacterota bacterium]|jgi:RimJ/RimL family protein N-acetyltransferase
MNLNLRPPKLSDKKYFIKWWTDPYLISMTSGRKEDPVKIAKFFPKLLKSKNPQFIILADTKPIGHIMVRRKSKTVFRTPIIIGERKHRGKGVGTWALRKILQMGFVKLNYKKAYLEVRPENKNAISTYKKLGFHKKGIKLYKDNKYLSKVIMMELMKSAWKKSKLAIA